MNKRYKYLLAFFLISFILVAGFSGYYYWYNLNNPEEVPMLSNTDWSYPTKLLSDLYSRESEFIIDDDKVNVFWIDRSSDESHLVLSKFDRDGRETDQDFTYSAGHIRNMNLYKNDDGTHIFLLTGPDDDMNITMLNFDENLELNDTRTLFTDINNGGGLNIVGNENEVVVSWHHRILDINSQYQIGLLRYDLADDEVIENPELHVSEYDSRYPTPVLYNDNISLIWFEMDETGRLKAGTTGRNNRYMLTWQQIDSSLEPVEQSLGMERALVRNRRDTARYIINDDTLWIYSNYYDTDERADQIVSLNLDLSTEEQGELSVITDFGTRDPYPEKQDDYWLAYVDQTGKDRGLRLIKSDDLINERQDGELLFPAHRFLYEPKIYTDEDETVLSWIRIEGGRRSLYFSSDKEGYKPDPATLLGLTREEHDFNFLSVVLYYLIMPFFPMAFNLQFLVFPFLASFAAYYLYRYLRGNNFKYKRLFAFVTANIAIVIGAYLRGNLEFLFFPSSPPENMLIPILIAAFIAVIIFFRIVKEQNGLAFFIGFGMVIVLLYWIAQINLVFQTFNYFL
ncbi:MAG: ECF transporter S component [Bacillota bacterium]